MQRPNSTASRDIAYHLHPYTNLKRQESEGPLVVTDGKGIHVFDESGKDYIEGMSGLWCTSLGFGEERLVEAATRQMRRLAFYHGFGQKAHDVAGALAEQLIALMPVPMSKVVLQQFRLGGQRHRGQDGLVLQQRAGPAAQEEDHRAHAGLSRRHRRVGEPHRAGRQPPRFRPADRQHAPRRLPASLPLRRAGRERGGLRRPPRREPRRSRSSARTPRRSPPSSPSR